MKKVGQNVEDYDMTRNGAHFLQACRDVLIHYTNIVWTMSFCPLTIYILGDGLPQMIVIVLTHL
jgi:hypothetical protein